MGTKPSEYPDLRRGHREMMEAPFGVERGSQGYLDDGQKQSLRAWWSVSRILSDFLGAKLLKAIQEDIPREGLANLSSRV